MSRLYLLLLTLCLAGQVRGQSVDWSWWAQEDSVFVGQANYNSIDSDNDGNFVISFYSFKKTDFTAFGGTVPIGNKGNWIKGGLIKFDTKGNYLWSFIGHTDTNKFSLSNQTFRVVGVVAKDNYYYTVCLAGIGKTKLYKDNLLLDSFDYTGYSSPYVLIKLDSSAQIQWIREIYASRTYPPKNHSGLQIAAGSVDKYEKGITFTMFVMDSAYLATNSTGTLPVKYSQPTCSGTTVANPPINIFYDTAGFLDTMIASGNTGLYFFNGINEKSGSTIYGYTLCDSTTLGGITFYKNDGNYFRLDASYNLTPLMRLKYGVRPTPYLKDYRSFASFTPGFNQSSNQAINDTLELFADSAIYQLDTGEMMVFNEDYKLLRRKKVFNYTAADSIRLNIGRHCIDSNVIYLFGEGANLSSTRKNILFNGITYSLPQNRSFSFLFKMDEYLNVLWVRFDTVTSSTAVLTLIRDMVVDKNRDIIFAGYMAPNNSRDFFGVTLPSQSFQYNFVVKLRDQNITRGEVYPGPYCSGDSLKIPYETQGKFDTANYFIAQLSDENGDFDDTSKIIELGRLKQTAGDTIVGKLPLYQLNTSAAYRIRIISTSPPVQSFYKTDTLRLLIYSKDTANAGPDLAICKGQSIQLDTRGGSRWHWSPASKLINPADSVKRNPFVNPMDTTEFRIIISDSSGCGVTDTDYVYVNVRPYITHSFIADTQVCKGYTQTLKSLAVGGNSASYWYKWQESTSLDIISTTDSLTVSPVKTTSYIITIGDSCTDKVKEDTITIHVDTVLTALTSPDTTICRGSSATVEAYGSGCNPKYYKYEWTEKGKLGVLGTTELLTVSPATTTEYQVLLKDTSTLLQDTAIVKVMVDNVFKLTLTKDSTICTGQSLVLQAGIISCDTSQMHYTWDNGLGDGPAKVVSPTTSTTYTVIGENKFNGLRDTAKVTVTVRPPLSISVNADTTICIGETAELRATTSGGDMPNHSVVWSEIGGGSTVNGQQTTVSPAKTTTYRAFLTDGCTVEGDSAEITVTVRQPLKVTVNADTTICVGESAELRATLSGGHVPSHSLLWTVVGGLWTSNGPTATVSPVATTTYRAVLTDNCTVEADSAELTVTVRPPLKVTVNADTTICVGESAELRTLVSGGYVPNHSIVWSEVGGQWSVTSVNATVSPVATTTYRAVLTDNCTIAGDSAEVKITVRPPLQVAISAKDSICANQQVILTASLSGGYTPGHSILLTSDHGLLTNQNPATDIPQTTTTYIARLSDNCSPDAYDTAIVIVVPAVVADFSLQPNEGCPPLTVTLTDLSTGHDTLLNVWRVQGVNIDGISQLAHEFVTTGKYTIGLTVANSLGCADTKTEVNAVTVFEKPTAQFIVKPEIKEIESPLYLYHQSSRATRYTWDFGDGNYIYQNNNNDTFYTYNEPGDATIRLIAENEKGCLDTQTQLIRVFDRINCVIPNAFTPNNRDDLNPTFAPVCSGDATYEMTIFNRWGQVIQHCENCAWDGTFANNPVPAGVYLYKLIITGESKKKATSFGSVNVVR